MSVNRLVRPSNTTVRETRGSRRRPPRRVPRSRTWRELSIWYRAGLQGIDRLWRGGQECRIPIAIGRARDAGGRPALDQGEPVERERRLGERLDGDPDEQER